ncbi:hypothetical protein [Edwardsiella piscicida]|uniref:hypothetical protein n=1 Tax=Edwardsiella piscicida TaxID=1263550 RepID=UPI00247A6D96|nr:hypothetical protein [Edwardsiella piscicida]WGS75584.1 hypothetical protein PED68_09410 [Edwardsiella piscicida]WGS78973.1 hypothetical protein PED70_09415 [Edwardsiella piscicida]
MWQHYLKYPCFFIAIAIITSHAAFVSATDNATVESRSAKVNISDIFTSTLYSNGLSTISAFVSFVAVPASGYLSYHFAIKGEKRKEFNTIAEPILADLEVVRDSWSRHESLSVDLFDMESIAKIRRRISPRKAKIYDDLWSQYYLCVNRIKLNDQDYEDAFNKGVLVLNELQKIHRLR